MELKDKERIFLCELLTKGFSLKLDRADDCMQFRYIIRWCISILKGDDPKKLYKELERSLSIWDELYCDIYEEVYSDGHFKTQLSD